MHSLHAPPSDIPNQAELLNGGAGRGRRVTTEPAKRIGAGFLVVRHPPLDISFCSVTPTVTGSACPPLALLPTDLTNIVSEAGFIHAINISKYEPAHTPGAQLLERYAIGNFPACALPNLLPLVFRSLASQSTKSRHISAAFSYKSAKIVSAHPRQMPPRIVIYRLAASDRSSVAACNIKTLRLRRHAKN